MYKTLIAMWLLEIICPASEFVSAGSDEARNPQHFIHAAVTSTQSFSHLTLPFRIQPKNRILKHLLVEVGVNLGGENRFVPKHLLHGS